MEYFKNIKNDNYKFKIYVRLTLDNLDDTTISGKFWEFDQQTSFYLVL